MTTVMEASQNKLNSLERTIFFSYFKETDRWTGKMVYGQIRRTVGERKTIGQMSKRMNTFMDRTLGDARKMKDGKTDRQTDGSDRHDNHSMSYRRSDEISF